jgi:hypothetical protein
MEAPDELEGAFVIAASRCNANAKARNIHTGVERQTMRA